MNWYINFGVADILAQNLDVTDLEVTYRSLARDTAVLSFSKLYDAIRDASFAPGAEIWISRGSQPVFYGRAGALDRCGADGKETCALTVDGLWWWMENIPATSSQSFYNPSFGTFTSRETTTFTIGEGKIKTSLDLLLNLAIAKGAPFTTGVIDVPDVVIPAIAVCDHTISQVLLAVLKWVPNALSWFDYSQKVPTLNICKHDSTAIHPKTISSANGDLASLTLAETDDEVVRGVIINYEADVSLKSMKVLVTPGGPYEIVEETRRIHLLRDAYPAGTVSGQGILQTTVDVPGSHVAFEWRPKTEPYMVAGASAEGNEGFVKLLCLGHDSAFPKVMYNPDCTNGYLLQADADEIEWLSAQPSGATFATLMNYYPVGKFYEKYLPPAELLYSTTNPTGIRLAKARVYFQWWYDPSIGGTRTLYTSSFVCFLQYPKGDWADSSTILRKYTMAATYTPAVAGLARKLYDSLVVKHHEGEAEVDISGTLVPLAKYRKLSITGIGGNTIVGYVQSVGLHAADETCRMAYGPPEHLGQQDLIELQRLCRLYSKGGK